MRLSLIVAVADNGVIGLDGKMPWHVSADLKHFKALTLGKPVIMGRKTYESIGKALPHRQNIVLSRDPNLTLQDARVVPDFESALWAAADVDEVFVIGGAGVFAAALNSAERIYWTEIHASPEGDVFFPPFAREGWREISREDFPQKDMQPAFSFVTLTRAAS